ncbi:MAG: hypothetical protein A7316_02740, partial [Candidatus Altiarchaeales archaeon WOR_SM1_86-2]
RTVLSFIVSIAILYLVISSVNVRSTIEIMTGADPLLYICAFVAYYLTFPLRGLRWKILLENIGFQKNIKDLTEIVFLSWFVNCILPAKLGDLYRAYLVKQNYSFSGSKTLGTVFIERLLDLLLLLVLMSILCVLIFTRTPAPIVDALKILLLLILALTILLLLLKFRPDAIVRVIGSIKVPQIEDYIMRFRSGISAITSRTMPSLIFCTAAIWLLEAMRLFFVTRAVALDLPLTVVLFVAFAAAVLTAVPITPAGLGVVEASMLGILVMVGISADAALSVALLDRFISYWSLIAIGGITFFMSNKNQ